MKYAIETLQIELAKVLESQRAEERYSVYPEYYPQGIDWQAKKAELLAAIKALWEVGRG